VSTGFVGPSDRGFGEVANAVAGDRSELRTRLAAIEVPKWDEDQAKEWWIIGRTRRPRRNNLQRRDDARAGQRIEINFE
jgi:hypothetical protein